MPKKIKVPAEGPSAEKKNDDLHPQLQEEERTKIEKGNADAADDDAELKINKSDSAASSSENENDIHDGDSDGEDSVKGMANKMATSYDDDNQGEGEESSSSEGEGNDHHSESKAFETDGNGTRVRHPADEEEDDDDEEDDEPTTTMGMDDDKLPQDENESSGEEEGNNGLEAKAKNSMNGKNNKHDKLSNPAEDENESSGEEEGSKSEANAKTDMKDKQTKEDNEPGRGTSPNDANDSTTDAAGTNDSNSTNGNSKKKKDDDKNSVDAIENESSGEEEGNNGLEAKAKTDAKDNQAEEDNGRDQPSAGRSSNDKNDSTTDAAGTNDSNSTNGNSKKKKDDDDKESGDVIDLAKHDDKPPSPNTSERNDDASKPSEARRLARINKAVSLNSKHDDFVYLTLPLPPTPQKIGLVLKDDDHHCGLPILINANPASLCSGAIPWFLLGKYWIVRIADAMNEKKMGGEVAQRTRVITNSEVLLAELKARQRSRDGKVVLTFAKRSLASGYTRKLLVDPLPSSSSDKGKTKVTAPSLKPIHSKPAFVYRYLPTVPDSTKIAKKGDDKVSFKPVPYGEPGGSVYYDWSNIPDSENPKERKAKGGVVIPFPEKVMVMLDTISTSHSKIVSWLPHGRAFRVNDMEAFTNTILCVYFKQTQWTSFVRQLSMYGFQKIHFGPDKGGYYHELFLRGRPSLCMKIKRERIKGRGWRKPADPEDDPDLYSMPALPPLKTEVAAADQSSASQLEMMEVSLLKDIQEGKIQLQHPLMANMKEEHWDSQQLVEQQQALVTIMEGHNAAEHSENDEPTETIKAQNGERAGNSRAHWIDEELLSRRAKHRAYQRKRSAGMTEEQLELRRALNRKRRPPKGTQPMAKARGAMKTEVAQPYWDSQRLVEQQQALVAIMEGLQQKEKHKGALNSKKRQYHEDHKEEINAKKRKYYEENKEEINAKKRKKREENKDVVNAKRKQYHEDNKEEINAKKRKYYEEHKEVINVKKRKSSEIIRRRKKISPS